MRTQLLTITFLAALTGTACGSGQSELVGTWKDPEDGGFLTIEDENGALRINVPPDGDGGGCDGLIEGEESPYEVTIICSDAIGNKDETAAQIKVVDEDRINLMYEEEVYFEYKMTDHILERVES